MKIATITKTAAAALILSLPLAAPSYAGPASDSLSRCLIEKSTKADRVVLTRWLFTVMARNPSVSDLSTVTPAKDAEIGKAAGNVVTQLITVACAKEAAAALKSEESDGFGEAFGALGELAMTELMSDPNVEAGTRDLVKHIDMNAFVQAMMANGGLE